MTHKVSIIIPVYRVEKYLEECLASVLSQDHEDLEVIVVDDASPDRSGAICDEWARRDPRVTVIHQSVNAGPSVARNTGIEIASGDYLSFVDSDDVVSPRLVSTMLAQGVGAEADIVVSGLTAFSGGVPAFSVTGSHQVATAEDVLHEIVCVRPRWSPWAKLYRRSLFDAGLRFPEGLHYGEDLYLAARAFTLARRGVLSDDALYGYRQRPDSAMERQRTGSVPADLVTVLTSNIELARAESSSAGQFKHFLAAYLLEGTKHLEKIDRGAAWRRNRSFREAYSRMARRYLPELLRCNQVSRSYRLAFAVSAYAPGLFREISRAGYQLKRSLLPRLSRHAP